MAPPSSSAPSCRAMIARARSAFILSTKLSVKAVLMLFTGTTLAVLALAAFGFDYNATLAQAIALHPKHEAMLAPPSFALAPVYTLSLGLAPFFGSSGLPRLIVRFFTVPDARTARASML